MARFFVGDSGATARRVKRFFIGDSGAVARQIKRAFVGDSGGVARLIFSGTDIYSGSMTAATAGGVTGYSQLPQGIISPPADVNGYDILTLTTNGTHLVLQLNVGSDPGQGYFSNLYINGSTVFNSSSASYNANGGQPIWTWSTAFQFVNTNVYAVEYL